MKNNSGMTLIELMIVVAIIGILAAVAFPSYSESVRQANRGDAQSGLMQLAQAMERFYGVNYTYVGTGASGGGSSGAPVSTVFAHTTTPFDGTTAYNLTLVATATTFTVTATPTGAQTSDTCGTLTLAQDGAKGSAGTDCW
ncbi:MAG: pilus assembly protein PilE [Moraxellaceae bacterium]|nr:MAG: pilus assembly protein PilE [Moraxellaceae bacterium]